MNSQTSLGNILSSHDYEKFHIPIYQRDYAWEVKNFEDLWEDLEESKESSREKSNEGHYLGTIVMAPHNQESKEVDIIDGQQRMTTTFMLLYALWQRLDDNDKEDHKSYFRKGGEYKLQVIDDNKKFFGQILEHATKGNLPSDIAAAATTKGQKNLCSVFNRILDKIKGFNSTKAKRYFEALLHMQLICFAKNNVGSAIKTFQSVNDRGMPLRLLDKLKALLIYYSNTHCNGKNGLDSDINDCFGGIFRISIQISEHKHCTSLFRSDESNEIEESTFRYHIGSNKFAGVAFDVEGKSHETNANDRYKQLKDRLKESTSDVEKLESFIKDYSEDLRNFFQAILDILNQFNTNNVNMEMYKAIKIEKYTRICITHLQDCILIKN